MLNIGITGGIGSGKTTVCKIFETLGIPIYYADDRAKFLMVTDAKLIEDIKNVFGDDAYLEDGSLNRSHIAKLAFNDRSLLNQLNGLVHPAVRKDTQNWANQQVGHPYILKEAALHFETGGYKLMDKMITVFAPKEMRIQRVLQRDSVTRQEVEARIDKQLPDEKKMELADFIIYNDGSKSLIQQVLEVHRQLITLNSNFKTKSH